MADPSEEGEAADLRPIGDVVAELRRDHPDVSHSSLRFLEREGLIEPHRTAGGHRLYAPADVARVRRIKVWQQQRLSLDDIRERLGQLSRLPDTARLGPTFLDLLVGRDVAGARRVILDADDAGVPVGAIFGEIMQPALHEVGARWERGELLVAQEKEISEIARELITELSIRHRATEITKRSVVAACVEGERHELGLRMICTLLRIGGRPAHYLGADVAPRFLREAVDMHEPAAVLLSSKLESNLRAVQDAIEILAIGPGPVLPFPILVGGRAVVEHDAQLRAWGAVPMLEGEPVASVREIETLLATIPERRDR